VVYDAMERQPRTRPHGVIDRTDADEILSPGALAFIARLAQRFQPRIDLLLHARVQRDAARAAGQPLDFRMDTRDIRAAEWKAAPLPEELERRVVEMTGSVDRKAMVGGLNSGADVFMADFEAATAPTWHNLIQGQQNLRDAVRGVIRYDDPGGGRIHTLTGLPSILMVRPRGLHLSETHVVLENRAVPAALFDFGLFLYHNARELCARGSAPYFYLPKLECAEEALVWNEIFNFSQDDLGIARGTVKATVSIDTLSAAFELDEIIFALRDHITGLSCGRFDYTFSFIKTQRYDALSVTPDRSQITMMQPCMRAFAQLAITTCHRRGILAIGSTTAQIPIADGSDVADFAIDRVRADKLREVNDGHDGTGVSHTGLVRLARDIFETHIVGDNQINRRRPDPGISREHLLATPQGTRTNEGLRTNIRTCIRFLESWLGGNGSVPLYNLVENLSTAELARIQVWHWLRHGATLEDGRVIDLGLYEQLLGEEMARVEDEVGAERFANGRFAEAQAIFDTVATSRELHEFLPSVAAPLLAGAGPRIILDDSLELHEMAVPFIQ